MIYSRGIGALVLAGALLSCKGVPEPGTPGGPPVALATEDLRDNVLPPSAAEPPWRDFARHTSLAPHSRATHPGPAPDGSAFAYATSEFGPRLQIAWRETYGAAPLQISYNKGDNLFPRISPDGKKVAYASNREGNWDIYVARIDAPLAVTQITFEPGDDIAPAWSPDGKKVAYASRTEDGVWQVVLADVGSRVKTYLGPGLYPDWSPNAKDPWLAFQSQPRHEGGRSGVWVVRPDGTGLREVAGDKARTWSAINPRFSPDGKWIAYATVSKSPESRAFGGPGEADDIWLIRLDGTLDMRLTDDLSAEWWPAWGGDRVFFVCLRDGMQNICSVRVKPLEDDK